jgi:hypothetical protein
MGTFATGTLPKVEALQLNVRQTLAVDRAAGHLICTVSASSHTKSRSISHSLSLVTSRAQALAVSSLDLVGILAE